MAPHDASGCLSGACRLHGYPSEGRAFAFKPLASFLPDGTADATYTEGDLALGARSGTLVVGTIGPAHGADPRRMGFRLEDVQLGNDYALAGQGASDVRNLPAWSI